MIGVLKKIKRLIFTLKVKSQAATVGNELKVNGKSSVSVKTHLGSNVNFNGIEISGSGNVTIGDNFHSGRGCLIITQNHNYDSGEAIPYDSSYIIKDVTIDDNVWIGERVIILAGVHIGEGAIIQAGSVVVSDIPKCAIAGGHPAKIFRYRDIDHYEQLKEKKSFF